MQCISLQMYFCINRWNISLIKTEKYAFCRFFQESSQTALASLQFAKHHLEKNRLSEFIEHTVLVPMVSCTAFIILSFKLFLSVIQFSFTTGTTVSKEFSNSSVHGNRSTKLLHKTCKHRLPRVRQTQQCFKVLLLER